MKRNSILELYKFIYALIILIYHNNMFFENEKIHYNGRFAVCFFFMISGYYLYDKSKIFISKNAKNTYIKFILYKLKSFGFPLLIAYIFSVTQTIITKEYNTGFLHYLWFIHILLIYKGFALLLIKYVKKEKTIDIVMLISMCIGIGLRFIPSLREFTEVLCFIYIPLGYYIRKIKLPYKDNLVCFIISLLWLALSVYIFTINKTNLYLEFLLGLIVLPSIFILVENIDYKSIPVLNFLGSISLEIYVYQSVTRCLQSICLEKSIYRFITILLLVVVTELIKYVLKNKNNMVKTKLLLNR